MSNGCQSTIHHLSTATSCAKISEARSSQAFMTYLPADNSFPEQLRRWSQEPFWWAAIASLGVHSLLWVALPFLPSSAETEQAVQKPVELIQLTPQEQSRVPDFAAPQATIPAFPTRPNNALPGQGFSLSPLPNQGFSRFPSSTLPPFFVPPVPPLPPLSSFRPRTTTRLPQRSPLVIPPPPPSLPPATPANPATPNLSPGFTNSGRSLNVPRQNGSASLPSLTAAPTPGTPPLFSRPPSSLESPPPSTTPSTSPSPTSNGATGTSSPGASNSPSSATTPGASNQPLSPAQQLTELRRREPRLFTFNPQGASSDQANLAYLGWLDQIGRQEQDPEDLEKVELSSTYPAAACLLAPELENKAVTSVAGVVVDADDKLVDDPVLLRSGEYGIFGAEAIALARAHTFDNPTDTAQPYLVEVTFTYSREACTPAS